MRRKSPESTPQTTTILKVVDGVTYRGHYTVAEGFMSMRSGDGSAYGKVGPIGEVGISDLLFGEIIRSGEAEIIVS
nr:hypothetical protein [uncultured Rhodopila sp.]